MSNKPRKVSIQPNDKNTKTYQNTPSLHQANPSEPLGVLSPQSALADVVERREALLVSLHLGQSFC